MFKAIRPLTVVISVLTLMMLVLTACAGNQATRPISTPTKAAAKPAAAQAAPTTVKAAATPAAAKSAANTASTKAMTMTAETKTTPAAAKAIPAALKQPAAAATFIARLTTDKTLGQILTDDRGMTLYTFKNDQPNQSTCDAACAEIWPPVVVKDAKAKLELPSEATGKLGVIERQDGMYQVTYNEMPLYRYAQDAKPGEVKGENIKELWHVIAIGKPQGAANPASATGSKTWTVLVGGEAGIEQQEHGPAGAWQFMRFYPESITINAGDTIVWQLNSAEPHTVTLPKPGEKSPELVVAEAGKDQRMMFNPLAILPQGKESYDGTALTGSGQMGGEPQFPTEYKLTFTKPGTYDYFCAFHPMMKGTVVVQAAGEPYPETQAQIYDGVREQLEADTQAAMKAKPEAEKAATRPGPNGSTIYEVKMGYGDGILAWMRFNPTKLTIKVGDTVEWNQADTDTPHTVTFTSEGQEPEMVLAEKQAAGPPNLILNPEVLMPAGKGTYSGTGYFNSGFIWGTKDPTPGPRTYSLTFDTPGTYKYTCILHDMMGMQGEITVQPKGK